MTPDPRRARRLRVVLALLLLAVTAAGPAAARPTAPHQEGPGRGPGAGATGEPVIRLIQQDAVVAANGDFTAFLEVEGVPEGSDLAIDIYPLLDDEELLADALAGTPRNSEATFPVVDLPGDPAAGPVQTGFVINLSSPDQPNRPGGWAKRLDDAGVYPLRIRLRGPDNTTLETMVTFLVRAPDADDDVERVPVALVPQVVTGITPDAALDDPTGPLDDERLNAIDTLAETFTTHPEVPASFVVPADVVRRLTAAGTGDEADPGTGTDDGDDGDDGGSGDEGSAGEAEPTTTTDDDPDPGPVDGSAAAVLDRLRAALDGEQRELLASPYVDVNPTELVDADLVEELTRQQTLGFRDLAEAIEPPAGDTWLLRRALDTDTVDALADIDITDLLVPPGSIAGEPPALPTRLTGATDQTRAVVLDPALSVGQSTDPALAAQRLFAHLIARSAIADGAPQLVTVPLPDQVGDVVELDALLEILSGDTTFLEPTTVTDLLDGASSAPDRATLAAPDLAPAGDYPDELRETHRLAAAYGSMLPDRPDLVADITEPLSLSAAAGLSEAVRVAHVREIRDEIEDRFAEVSIPASDRVTLGARDAQFPLVISSGSDVPLRVIVELTSASDRLTVKEPRVEVLLEGDRTVVPVQLHSRSPGDTPIRITVTTLDGQVILSQGTYSVRSTAVSGVGLLLTVGAGLFLALWWGRHFVRARRAKARHAR